jgi:hypothetical protein
VCVRSNLRSQQPTSQLAHRSRGEVNTRAVELKSNISASYHAGQPDGRSCLMRREERYTSRWMPWRAPIHYVQDGYVHYMVDDVHTVDGVASTGKQGNGG